MSEEEKQLENHESSGGDSSGFSEQPLQAVDPVNLQGSDSQVTADPLTEPGQPANAGVDSNSAAESLDTQALAQVAQELESLRGQLEERDSQYKRIAADFDNFRKRTQKEKEDLQQQTKRNTLSELLPVVDSFERARSHIKPQTDAEAAIHKSYQGVYKQLVDCLKRIGVAPMRPEGKPFDPNLHEAVMREATEAHPEGTVLEELVRGYLLGDRVLRHSMVKVAAAPEPVVASEENT